MMSIYSKPEMIEGFPVPKIVRGMFFGKLIGGIAPEMDGALAFKKKRGPTWRPEDQFGGIWWWSEFPIFPQNMKIDFPHAM